MTSGSGEVERSNGKIIRLSRPILSECATNLKTFALAAPTLFALLCTLFLSRVEPIPPSIHSFLISIQIHLVTRSTAWEKAAARDAGTTLPSRPNSRPSLWPRSTLRNSTLLTSLTLPPRSWCPTSIASCPSTARVMFTMTRRSRRTSPSSPPTYHTLC